MTLDAPFEETFANESQVPSVPESAPLEIWCCPKRTWAAARRRRAKRNRY